LYARGWFRLRTAAFHQRAGKRFSLLQWVGRALSPEKHASGTSSRLAFRRGGLRRARPQAQVEALDPQPVHGCGVAGALVVHDAGVDVPEQMAAVVGTSGTGMFGPVGLGGSDQPMSPWTAHAAP
jgi:hypothetical protein